MFPQLHVSDFPALCRAADQASAQSQRLYLWLVRLSLGLLVIGAALGFFAQSIPDHKHGLSVTIASGVAGRRVANLFVLVLAPDGGWVAGRSMAGAGKTLTWRYMLCAEPYHAELTSKDADDRFLNDLAIMHLTTPTNHRAGQGGG